MKAFVINLAASTERRRHMQRQLERLGIEHEFVAAVDGGALTAGDRQGLVCEDAVARASDWLRPGIIGCCLSHVAAYRAIAADGAAAALVLEDDVILPTYTADLLTTLASSLDRREVALMYYRSIRSCRLSDRESVSLAEGHRLLYPIDLEPLNATTAYVITREACLSMIDFVIPVRTGPDSWSVFVQAGALDRVRCVQPRPFGARTDFKSTIDYLGGSTSAKQRVMGAVSRHRIFPLFQIAAWRRAQIERNLSQFSVVSERSPHSPQG